MHYIFFTKTNWSELPRIRHQLAKLLLDNGNTVDFFEKSTFIFPFVKISEFNSPTSSNSLRLLKISYLIHHQFRFFKILHYINKIYEIFQIKKFARSVPSDVVIVNFNYDFFFIRELFPCQKIIFFLNDDFIKMLKFKHTSFTNTLYNNLAAQCDFTLTVSNILKSQIDKKNKTLIFYPWANFNSSIDKINAISDNANCFLIYGYIDDRFDFDFLLLLASKNLNFYFHLVGPLNKTAQNFFDDILPVNIKYMGISDLNSLDQDRYLASLLLYRGNNLVANTIEIPNRAFQLLKFGVPLIYYGLPYLYQSDVFFKINSNSDFIDTVNLIKANKLAIRDQISSFLTANSDINRYNYLLSILC